MIHRLHPRKQAHHLSLGLVILYRPPDVEADSPKPPRHPVITFITDNDIF
jgi:hypothetical protein